jgi:hypothetical protein
MVFLYLDLRLIASKPPKLLILDLLPPFAIVVSSFPAVCYATRIGRHLTTSAGKSTNRCGTRAKWSPFDPAQPDGVNARSPARRSYERTVLRKLDVATFIQRAHGVPFTRFVQGWFCLLVACDEAERLRP